MITEIKKNDTYAQKQMDALLAQEGICRDRNLDYSCAIFDDEYEIMATGSCFKNTIRCTAVSKAHQGEGLLNRIVSHLMTIQAERGNSHVFIYTKPESAQFFSDIGFYEIARTDSVAFMENRRGGLAGWTSELKTGCADDADRISGSKNSNADISAIVMNANPFTKGHRYLVEQAARDSRIVHVFVVSEEAGPIPFSVRRELVRAGTADLENVICHDSGSYIISSATFPGYFLKDEDEAVRAQAELDIKVFSLIAKELGITVRYAGDEPYSATTAIYNEIMQSRLPDEGIKCVIVPRLRSQEKAISASIVRRALHDGDLESVRDMLPETTLEYFRSESAEPVIRAIMDEEETIQSATLPQILAAREERMAEQNEMLLEYGRPLISFTMNIAGPVKNSPLIRKAFEEGARQLDAALLAAGVKVVCSKLKDDVTGCELLYCVDAGSAACATGGSMNAGTDVSATGESMNAGTDVSATDVSLNAGILEDNDVEKKKTDKTGSGLIKKICVEIEESSELGRLFDMDVIDPDGVKLDRAIERKCLICGKPGKGCASRRTHSVSELQEKTKEIITAYFVRHDGDRSANMNVDPSNIKDGAVSERVRDAVRAAGRISEMVTEALIEEVLTTPKPGLVDQNNNGSHKDMDIATFRASAEALRDFWGSCFLIGSETADGSPEDTFLRLRKEGISAEEKMYAATGGVNTHKGAIFLLGTICGAMGRLWNHSSEGSGISDSSVGAAGTETITSDYVRIADAAMSTAECMKNTDAETIAAECAKMTRRIMESEIKDMPFPGARGEIAEGLPSVTRTALPMFRELLEKGYDRNTAGAGAFIALVARGTDTNMIKRGGQKAAMDAAEQAAKIVSHGKTTDAGCLEELDKSFIAQNLSPGGCADLLAITYFLYAQDQC